MDGSSGGLTASVVAGFSIMIPQTNALEPPDRRVWHLPSVA